MQLQPMNPAMKSMTAGHSPAQMNGALRFSPQGNRMAAPAVKFSGFRSGLKTLWSTLGSIFSLKILGFQTENAVAVYTEKKQQIRASKEQAEQALIRVQGQTILKKRQYDNAVKSMEKEKREALEAKAAADKATETAVKELLLKDAEREALEWVKSKEVVAAKLELLESAKNEELRAKVQVEQAITDMEALMAEYDKKISKAEMLKEKEAFAETRRELDQLLKGGIQTGDTAAMDEELERRDAEADAALNQGMSMEDIQTRAKANELKRQQRVNDAFAELMAESSGAEVKQATTAKGSSGSAGSDALAELDAATKKQ